jgi:hypothetical protein
MNLIFGHLLSREYHRAVGVIGIPAVPIRGVTFHDCHAGFKAEIQRDYLTIDLFPELLSRT